MLLSANDLAALVTVSAVPTQSYMPFVLVAVPIVLVLLLLFLFGRQRRHRNQHGEHEE
jgi:hypothetical protein